MLARRVLPASYLEWNQRWSAPHGSAWTRRLGRRWWTSPIAASLVGPFAFQANNDTRRVEYPWAYDALALVPGLNVLEVGGGLSGFQFALSRCGCRVTNVDPADETAVHWPLDRRTLGLLNRRFGTSVMLKQCFVQEAGLTADAFDRAVSISVIEHIRREDIVVVLDHVRRALKPARIRASKKRGRRAIAGSATTPLPGRSGPWLSVRGEGPPVLRRSWN